MDVTLQPECLKFTIKLKGNSNLGDSSTTSEHLNNAEGERTLNAWPEDQVAAEGGENAVNEEFQVAAEGGENAVNEENQNSENSQYQLVLYDPAINEAGNSDNTEDNVSHLPSVQRLHPFSDRTPRVLPSIGAFTVQCANCFKWRLIPTKEKYEEIREHIIAQPFLCETAREWKPDISCDDPPDITQDGSRLWAIDKPNIAQPPTGWERLLRIRGEGSTKFADVYYVAPSGKILRSTLEIQRYLDKHPELMNEEVSLSRFSFKIPKPLQEDYVRKRPARPALQNDADDLGNQHLPPSKVARITWVSTDVDTDLQLSNRALANDHLKEPGSNLEI